MNNKIASRFDGNLTEILTVLYQMAYVIRRKDFYQQFTAQGSIFGVDESREARIKLLYGFRFTANQRLHLNHNQVVPVKELLIKMSDLFEKTADEWADYYELKIQKGIRKVPKSINWLATIKQIISEGDLFNISPHLSFLQRTRSYNLVYFDATESLSELVRTCNALNTLNTGTGNNSFDSLTSELLKRKNYFAEGYPKDLLCYDADAVRRGDAISIRYKPDYCSTYLELKGREMPDVTGYETKQIRYGG
jgi:hypothetical protein